MSFIKVAGKQGLVRDSSTGAIINTDDQAREAYLAKRRAAEQQQLEKQMMQRQINQLENHVNDIDNKLNIIISLLKNTTV